MSRSWRCPHRMGSTAQRASTGPSTAGEPEDKEIFSLNASVGSTVEVLNKKLGCMIGRKRW